MRFVVLLLAVVLVAGGLASCASRTEQYCGTLREDRHVLAKLASGTGKGRLQRTLAVFQELRREAPEDLTDEWDTLVYAWQTLASSFRKAGVDPDTYRPDNRPADVTPREARNITDAANELRSARVLDAGRSIEQHAHDVCHVDLGL